MDPLEPTKPHSSNAPAPEDGRLAEPWRPEDEATWRAAQAAGEKQAADAAAAESTSTLPGEAGTMASPVRPSHGHRRHRSRPGHRSAAGARPRGPRPRSATKHTFRRAMLMGAGVAVAILVAIVADGYYQAYKAYKDAAEVVPALRQARSELARGRVPSSGALARATGLATAAERRLDGARFTLSLTADIPLLGRPVRAVRYGVQAAADETRAAATARAMVVDLLGPSATNPAAGRLARSPLFHNGTVDVGLVESLSPQMDTLVRELRAADASIRAIPWVPLLHRVQALKAQALAESTRALGLAERVRSAVRVLPSFLGSHGPKTYFVALQNNADQRATGGAVLGYALVHIANGKISLASGGPISNIDNRLHGIPVRLPAGVAWYVRAAHVNPRINNGANYSPNFPEVARAWAAMVQRSTGVKVDGAIAMDPKAVAYALVQQKPIRVSSFPRVITAGNVVQATEHQQYLLPMSDQLQFPTQLVAAAFRAFLNPTDVTGLMRRMGIALAGRRVQLWSAEPQQQALFHELQWDGSLTASNQGDYVLLAENKRVANKVDFYAHQDIRYDVQVLPSGAVRSTYSVTLSSDVPPGQPRQVVGPWSPYGLNLAMLSLYAPGRARFVRVDPRGAFPRTISPAAQVAHVQPKGFVQHSEGPFRVFTQTVAAWPGHPAKLTFVYTTPGVIMHTAGGDVYQLTLQPQPLTRPANITVVVHLPEGKVIRSTDPGWSVSGSTATYAGALTHDLITRIVF